MSITRTVTFAAAVALGSILALAVSSALQAPHCLQAAPPIEPTEYARGLGEAYKKATDAVSPAVVHVASTRQIGALGEDFFGRFLEIPRDLTALGSGVIVKPDGYILTNYHVIKGADKLRVKLRDNRQFPARVVGADPPTDLAVIKVDEKDLPVAEIGDSDRLAVGHLVLAIGNPFGLDSTVTQGIISAKGRANVGIADYEDFIQTDAAINPGNSGGPLIDIYGKVIGINTAIFSRSGGFQGIGFAIPSNMIKQVLEALISQGHVTRGFLGVTIQNVTPDLAQALKLTVEQGAVVTEVMTKTPAEAAGIEKGDVIVEYEGRKVIDARQLRSMVATTAVGKKVEITVVRGGENKKLTVSIGEQKAEETPVPGRARGTSIERLGMQASDLTDEVRKQYQVKANRGVFVFSVDAGGPADKAGIKPGSVILEVNHSGVENVRQFEKLLKKIDPEQNVLLLVQERGVQYYVVIRPER